MPEPIKLSDRRNRFGLPKGLLRARGRRWQRTGNSLTNISGNEEQVTSEVDQSHHYNDLVPWFVILALVAGAALALVLDDKYDRPRELQLMLDKQRAEIRAEYSDAVAKAQAQADQAGTVAQLWKNRVDKLEAEVNANRRR